MSPWFASALLLLYHFPQVVPVDVEVDSEHVVWILSAAEPSLFRCSPDGSVFRFDLETDGLPSGLAVSPTGRWAVSVRSEGRIILFDEDDLPEGDLSAESPGDVVFSGLEIWAVNTAMGSLGPPGGQPVVSGTVNRWTRLVPGPSGSLLLTGSSGVFIMDPGVPPVMLAGSGSACFHGRRVVLKSGGVVFSIDGDTLFTEAPDGEIASSRYEGPLVVWGDSGISVLE